MGFEIINILKKEKGLTTQQLSDLSGVPKGTLNKILNGVTTNPAYETVVLLSKALGCDIDIFIDESINNISNIKNDEISKESKLVNIFNKLNEVGKDKVINYINDLIYNPQYIESNISKDETSATIESKAHDYKQRELDAYAMELDAEEKGEILSVLGNIKEA